MNSAKNKSSFATRSSVLGMRIETPQQEPRCRALRCPLCSCDVDARGQKWAVLQDCLRKQSKTKHLG